MTLADAALANTRPVLALLVYVAVSVRRVAGGPAAGGVCGAASPAVPGDNIDVIYRGGDDDGYDDDENESWFFTHFSGNQDMNC